MDFEVQRGEPHEQEEDDEDEELKATGTIDDFNKQRLKPVPDNRLAYSQSLLYSNTLSPGVLGSRTLESSPKPSPAWRGIFCLPGEEDSVSAIVDVSSIPSQTTTTTPVNLAPALGSTTPGGGRVCRVKEKVQGVIEKPWILRQKKKDTEREEKEGKGDRELKQSHDGTSKVRTPSEKERKGVVHIREVDGKLCVVRTVYPSDYGSPVWKGNSDTPGNILQVSLEDNNPDKMSTGDLSVPFTQTRLQDNKVRGMYLETPVCAQDHTSLLESGYTSDLPLTSPGTTGTTPSQTDWAGLTSSSSERLDSMMESCQSLHQQVTGKHLPEV